MAEPHYTIIYDWMNKDKWRDNYPTTEQREGVGGTWKGLTYDQAKVQFANHEKAHSRHRIAPLYPPDYKWAGMEDSPGFVPIREAIKPPQIMTPLQSTKYGTLVGKLPIVYSKFNMSAVENNKIDEARKLAQDLDDTELESLKAVLRDERIRRDAANDLKAAEERKAARYEECRPALAMLFLNIAHAMACRMALRWLKGHNPVGKDPEHGRMWTAPEGAELERRVRDGLPPMVRDKNTPLCSLKYNPLTWRTEADIKGSLKHGLFSGFYGEYKYNEKGHTPWPTGY